MTYRSDSPLSSPRTSHPLSNHMTTLPTPFRTTPTTFNTVTQTHAEHPQIQARAPALTSNNNLPNWAKTQSDVSAVRNGHQCATVIYTPQSTCTNPSPPFPPRLHHNSPRRRTSASTFSRLPSISPPHPLRTTGQPTSSTRARRRAILAPRLPTVSTPLGHIRHQHHHAAAGHLSHDPRHTRTPHASALPQYLRQVYGLSYHHRRAC